MAMSKVGLRHKEVRRLSIYFYFFFLFFFYFFFFLKGVIVCLF